MSTDKTEATRLADALERITYFNGKCDERDAAVQMLRRWPDAGEPVAWLVEGWHDGNLIAHIVHLTLDEAKASAAVFSQHYTTTKTVPLYTAPPAKPDFGSAAHALDDALVSAHLGTLESFPDARAALHALEAWNAQVALDPAVSPEAAKLHERIAALEAALEQARVALEAWERAQEYAAKYAHLIDARDSIVDAWVAADDKRDAALRAIEEVRK